MKGRGRRGGESWASEMAFLEWGKMGSADDDRKKEAVCIHTTLFVAPLGCVVTHARTRARASPFFLLISSLLLSSTILGLFPDWLWRDNGD